MDINTAEKARGLLETLADLNNGTVYLDFEGNEADMWEEEAKDLIPCHEI
ncbi:hypothetical protein J5A56_00570 [Prevotella melaninogenica]|nr:MULTISPECIES: hypothetical protein [Prevotella]ERJ80055.1 hypothetical protein HMPREF9148_00141 [Prevotella sp. F0091]QUB72929.1 hypothetical protein J5A56_00570 [Prevotella melaninogenica]